MRIWHVLDSAALLLEVALIVLAIRLYRRKRTRSFAWLTGACISVVFTSATMWILAVVLGVIGVEGDSTQNATLFSLGEHTTYVFKWLTLICLVATVFSFLREHRRDSTPTI